MRIMGLRQAIVRIALASAVASASLGVVTGQPERVVAASRGARLVPTAGVLFGAAMRSDFSAPDGYKNEVLNREAQLGRNFDIVNHFYPFSTEFPRWQEAWDISLGRTPMISWNGTSTTAINRGDYDSMIRTRARAVAALGAPVFMRWFWEMDGQINAAKAGTPAQYIASWNRIRGIFVAEGATNAVWSWCPNSWGFETGAAQLWYPGDGAVEWICADGYNWAPTQTGTPWRTWASIFADAHSFAAAHNKPLMVGEFGALERLPREKADWYTAARAAIKTMPNIAAIVAFDLLKFEADDNKWFVWNVDSSLSSLLSYMSWGRDPYFNTKSLLTLPEVSAGDGSIYETDGNDVTVSIPITLSAPSPSVVSVQSETSPYTAGAADFGAQSRLVKFNPGATRVFVYIRVRADQIDETHEALIVSLNSAIGATIRRASGVITIRDDDPGSTALRATIGDAAIIEGDSLEQTVKIPVTLSRDATTTVTVKYAVASSAATRGRDWSGIASGTLTFLAGQNLKYVTVHLLTDSLDEANEILTVTLSAAVGATITDASGTATILDDD